MNSYPGELLAQLAPVMFVAGLDPSPGANPTSPTTEKSKSQDSFSLLITRLRDALMAQRKVAIWQPEKSKIFQVILVDKAVRFPPRKLVPPEDPQYSAAHSPLSPLTPSSPLHPDGLIAPIWIRKHTTLLPSVFVLFMRIFESHSPPSQSPLDIPDPDREKEREMEERNHDTELAAEISLRKKDTNDRGIKLTVVLIASRKMLDDPLLDTRLTYIRRQSGLDSRAALFVLSPVSPTELSDFVSSLQQALYDPAVEYYTNHSKRVRRKRNRHSSTISTYPNPAIPPLGGVVRPLRPEGWTVRYEYKMACFAEFRGEDEVALKHYQDAYQMLTIMFGSTAILPPRTKRWAEAKVLADCINVKISKLYLYNNEHALALSHHSTHMRKFGDFSRGWGIGEETFEFWSWIARQHRVLAELLEQGTLSTLTIPTHLPVVPSSTLNSSLSNSSLGPGSTLPTSVSGQQRYSAIGELESLRSLGMNPSHALQHPGFYYYMSARCTEMRRDRYLKTLAAETTEPAISSSPGFANEKKVDHLVIILELYTKAYELFKKYASEANQGQGRLTLWIAYRIAETYFESGKFDMAVRFFERIAKTYRREKWGPMLRPLLAKWYKCAQELKDVELCVRLLVEMLAYGADEGEELQTLQEDLTSVLKSTIPSSPDEPLLIDLSESEPLFVCSVVFWASEVKVHEPAMFQLLMTGPKVSELPITSISIEFESFSGSISILHDPTLTSTGFVKLDEVEDEAVVEVKACLRWEPGTPLVLLGTLLSKMPCTVKISRISVTLTEGQWKLAVPLIPGDSTRWLSSLDPPKFINVVRDDYGLLSIRRRPHSVQLEVRHGPPAYVDEEYPIILDIMNLDDRELDVVVDVLLQPTEVDGAVNTIRVDDERSSALIKGVPLGILAPGANLVKTLYITSQGAPGSRIMDISVRSTCGADEEDIAELLQTITVPTVEALKVDFAVSYRRSLVPRIGLGDLRGYEEDFWDDGIGGEAIVNATLKCLGHIQLEEVALERRNDEQARILDSSADDEDFSAEYVSGDTLSIMSRISLSPAEGVQSLIPAPGEYKVTWRRILGDGTKGPESSSVFPLSTLQPPAEELVALLDISPRAKLHEPTNLSLTIRNHHATRTANISVQLEPDPSDGFVVAGVRSSKLPLLLPGGEEKVFWKLIPVECGYLRLPKIIVFDRRKALANVGGTEPVNVDGDIVKVVDVRVERRGLEGPPASVLVLP
ncbi:Gryzun, putative trafficking through golgi-domain-containing protein [Mycena floridula]|nr:Gryzun, putative trafficking through golgi-domain-containing protein [Mycena floridula]